MGLRESLQSNAFENDCFYRYVSSVFARTCRHANRTSYDASWMIRVAW
jgi:hypothetical protein